jgi:hypothetical protein
MKILDLTYISDCNNILKLEDNEIFIIKYLIKKIDVDINKIFHIKNKKNIINEYNINKYIKRFEIKCNGLLFKVNNSNNIINIFTINKYKLFNNVLSIKINLLEKIGYIENIKYYKKYKKYDILQIGLKIMKIFQYNNFIKECIILNKCFLYKRYDFNINAFFKKKVDELDILLGFYKEYIKYYKYLKNIYPYNKNENFKNKLEHLIEYKINIIYSSIKTNTFITYLYDVVIKDLEIIPHKYMLSIFEYPKEAIKILEENIIKDINYYKNNKNIYLEKYYKEIYDTVFLYIKNFNIYENMKDKILNDDVYNLSINDIRNYIKNGLNYIIKNKKYIPIEWNIKNIDKLLFCLTEKCNKINFSNNFIKDYQLYIELLVIINTFYKYRNINIIYDFKNNIINDIFFFTKKIDCNIYSIT